MSRAFKLFVFFATSAFVLGAVGYLVLHLVMPRGYVFGAMYRMFLYHESHPFQYIGVVALTYGVIATLCALRWSHLVGRRRFTVTIGIIIVTILVASVPGGMLWVIHDMQSGYFTTGARFWNDLLWGAFAGLCLGWRIIAFSMPYNIMGLIVGYTLTIYGFRIAAVTHSSSPLAKPLAIEPSVFHPIPNTLTLPMKTLVWARLEDSLLISRHGKSSSELGSVMI